MTRLILALILATAATAAPVRDLQPAHFRAVHAEMWNRGTDPWGSCDIASAAVWQRAREYGYDARVITWDVPGSRYGHAIPVVSVNGKWHHLRNTLIVFDGTPFVRTMRSSYSTARDEIKTDPRWLGTFSRRPVVPGSVEVLDAPPASWLARAPRPVWQ